MRYSIVLIALLASMTIAAQGDDPLFITSEEDHERMLKKLGIKELRLGVNGTDPSASNAANYDESKAKAYSDLPDPLVTDGGREVTTEGTWWDVRRPEIKEHFNSEIYGETPQNMPSVSWEVVEERGEIIRGQVVTTSILHGTVDNSSYPKLNVVIEMSLSIPDAARGPAPVVLQMWPLVDMEFRPGGRRSGGPDWKAEVYSKGWAVAQIGTASYQEDNGAGLTRGIIGLMNKGQQRSPSDWGVLKAWAWGVSRALDYLETNGEVDATRVAVHGHSRWGKAALIAMAYDQRFAAAYISSSGAGGAKIYRRDYGETVENLASSEEYHWMAGNFLKYAGPKTPNDLPTDAHELIAMCAPRLVFIGCGKEGDQWVDPKGMFLAAAHASPVYELLGAEGLGTAEMPPVGTGLTDGQLAFRQHEGGHTPAPNWDSFIEFWESNME